MNLLKPVLTMALPNFALYHGHDHDEDDSLAAWFRERQLGRG
jgi:hypothetical protein